MTTTRRVLVLAGLLLALSSGSLAETTAPLCVLDPARMPESWRPPPELQKDLTPAPWSKSEAKDVQYAIERGVDEMIGYFRRKPSAVESLWGDSIEALIQVTYASANPPALDAKVRAAARDNLTTLIDLSFKRKPDPADVACEDYRRLLPLAIFAHELYPANDPRTARVTKRTNAAYRACASLKAATGAGPPTPAAVRQVDVESLFRLYMWALWFMEAEPHPAIELPAEARAYGPALWKAFESYPLPNASAFPEGPWDEGFIEVADVAPHIAHLPTGTNRFPLYVEDSPDLYRFHRENFYAVMQVDELDLFASFVDTLRQYGCTPENDIQVRDGTRHLLKLFHDGNDRWMDFRREGETDDNIDDYALIHYPWTAVLGIRPRRLDPPQAGSPAGSGRRGLPPHRPGRS